LVPPEGVYAGRAVVAGTTYAAAISIGRTPTFGGEKELVEAHLLDFEDDLYGTELRLEFLAWLRGQQRFESSARLQEQVKADILQVRQTVANWA
jgi:riboflavin kinase/FMN adenylyltransferase